MVESYWPIRQTNSFCVQAFGRLNGKADRLIDFALTPLPRSCQRVLGHDFRREVKIFGGGLAVGATAWGFHTFLQNIEWSAIGATGLGFGVWIVGKAFSRRDYEKELANEFRTEASRDREKIERLETRIKQFDAFVKAHPKLLEVFKGEWSRMDKAVKKHGPSLGFYPKYEKYVDVGPSIEYMDQNSLDAATSDDLLPYLSSLGKRLTWLKKLIDFRLDLVKGSKELEDLFLQAMEGLENETLSDSVVEYLVSNGREKSRVEEIE